MPFLIKSSGGQRTCQLITNKTHDVATRDDIIEALRGLTFKFEVKIVDILPPDVTGGDQPAPSASGETNGSTYPAKIEQVQSQIGKTPSAEAAQPTHLTEAPKATVTQQPRFIPKSIEKQVLAPQPPVQVEEPKKVEEKRESPIYREVPKPIVTPVAQVEKAVAPPKPVLPPSTEEPKKQAPKPTLVRGELKVGATVCVCCVCVVDASPPALCYVGYNSEKLIDVTNIIGDIALDIEAQPEINSVEIGDIVFAKAQEDNAWYRSVVEFISTGEIGVYFFDWGLRESLNIKRIRRLTQPDLGLSKIPACAVKVKFTNGSGRLLDEVLESESEFTMKVDFYDDVDECYVGTILAIGNTTS